MRKEPNKQPSMPRPAPPPPPPAPISIELDQWTPPKIFPLFNRTLRLFNAGKQHDQYYQSKHVKKPIHCAYCNSEIVYEFGIVILLWDGLTCCESCGDKKKRQADLAKPYSLIGRFLDFLVILWRLIK